MLQVSNRSIATQSPWGVLVLLIFITILGVLKEFLSDYKRKKADKEVNEAKFDVVVDVEPQRKEEDPLKEIRRRNLRIQGYDGQIYGYFSADVL